MRSIRGFTAFYVQFDSRQNILAANNFKPGELFSHVYLQKIKKNFTTPVVIDVECEAILSKSVSKGLKAQSIIFRS